MQTSSFTHCCSRPERLQFVINLAYLSITSPNFELPETDFGELASDRRNGFRALRVLPPFVAVTRGHISRCRGRWSL